MDLKGRFEIIINHHQSLINRHKSLTTRIAQLTAAGCVDASEYWRDGKYLYLLYSMKDGKRRKVYVGNHPLRIEEARQKLENYKTRSECIRTQTKLERDIQQIESLSIDCLQICSKEDLSAKSALISMGTESCAAALPFVPN